MPIRSYFGPATLVIDLCEERVRVHLEDRPLAEGQREWDGQIQAPSNLLWDALSGVDVRLRIGDREGPIVFVGHPASDGTARVRGSGPAPF